MYTASSYLSDPLWQRITAYRFDEPGAVFPFSQKLAAQQRWTAVFTQRAIEEYRKFIYLCCVSPDGASPSAVVDEVWHLHLTYTVDYWKRFCNETLQQEVHHHPSKGGADEKGKHNDWYVATLELYRKIFGVEPPGDVWPVPVAAIIEKAGPINSNALKKTYRTGLYMLVIPFLFIWFRYQTPNPFALSGPHFLLFYGLLILICLLQLVIAQNGKRNQLRQILIMELGCTDIRGLAWLSGGTKSLLVYLIGSMINSGQLQQMENGSYFIWRDRLDENSWGLFEYYTGDTISFDELKVLFHGTMYTQEQKFGALKTAYMDWMCSAIVPAVVFLVGIARFIQGISNDRPVGLLFLELLLFVAVYFGFVIYYSFHNVNELIFRRNPGFTEHIAEDFPRRVIFSGAAAVLAFPLLLHLSQEFNVSGNNSDGGGSSCSGGSSCGGSSCGGCSGS
ncbi:glycine-rich domain-containing protein [Chitinophagaceae bacterium MMS25-I14]